MKLEATENLAKTLMNEHKLHGWGFRFNRRKTSTGRCVYRRVNWQFIPGFIELSVHYVVRNPEETVTRTILHEIAHALTQGHGHDVFWKEIAQAIGGSTDLCIDVPSAPYTITASCPSCGNVFNRHRRPPRNKNWHCPPCGAENGRLIWYAVDANTRTENQQSFEPRKYEGETEKDRRSCW